MSAISVMNNNQQIIVSYCIIGSKPIKAIAFVLTCSENDTHDGALFYILRQILKT